MVIVIIYIYIHYCFVDKKGRSMENGNGVEESTVYVPSSTLAIE